MKRTTTRGSVAGLLMAAVIGIGAGACSSSTSETSSPSVSDKYTQTWGKNYAATTCQEWLDQMSPAQRFAGAADMLAGARNKGDGGTGLPDDDLISQFARDVDATCAAPTASLAEAGALTYLNARSAYRP